MHALSDNSPDIEGKFKGIYGSILAVYAGQLLGEAQEKTIQLDQYEITIRRREA